MSGKPEPALGPRPLFDRDDLGVEAYEGVHNGKGKVAVKHFAFGGASEPAMLLMYDLPPGTSEGVHVHRPGDPVEGSYDEFYYVIEGSGVMQIGDDVRPVRAGDHVFVPDGWPRGIENTDPARRLKVYLIAIRRDR